MSDAIEITEPYRKYVVEDRDGDLWTWDTEGAHWTCRSEAGENTWAELVDTFGPLQVFELVLPGAPDTVYVVHHHDIEKHAKSFNEGFAEACEQFESLLSEAREDLVLEGPAVDLMGYLTDAIKAMGDGR